MSIPSNGTLIPLVILTLLYISSVSPGLFFNKYTTRFCYNSPNVTVTSQCVYCNYFNFDSTVLGCTGSSAVTVNMTSTQAFCIIAQCLGQVRQTPIFLGRKKRDADDDDGYDKSNGKGGTEGRNDGNMTTQSPERTTQVVELTLDGKKERFVVAQEVKVDVYYQDPLYDDDYALLTDTADTHMGESDGSLHNESEINSSSSTSVSFSQKVSN